MRSEIALLFFSPVNLMSLGSTVQDYSAPDKSLIKLQSSDWLPLANRFEIAGGWSFSAYSRSSVSEMTILGISSVTNIIKRQQ